MRSPNAKEGAGIVVEFFRQKSSLFHLFFFCLLTGLLLVGVGVHTQSAGAFEVVAFRRDFFFPRDSRLSIYPGEAGGN